MTKQENAAHMANLVGGFKRSGQSQKAFAAAHGLSGGKLHYWIHKLSKSVQSTTSLEPSKKNFVAIEVTPEQVAGSIMIRLKSGVEIEIPL